MQQPSLASESLVTHRGQPVSRLGFAGQYLKEFSCVATAFEAGINYFFSKPQPTARERQRTTVSTLTIEAVQQWRTYGDLIYGNGQDAFETQWL